MPTYSAGSASLTIVPDAREFRSKLEADLRKVDVDYAVKITAELAKAREELDKFRAEQEGKAIKLRAEVDRSSLDKSFKSMRGDFENLGEKLASALKIDTAAVGIDLLPAMATGLAQVAQALEQVADAGLAVPGILAGVGASVGTVMLALGGVKEAWSAVSKASEQSASDQARQAQQVTSATNALRNAVVDEANAQKDVADARRDARHELEDLNIQLRGGALSEKEAILEAQKARRDLAQGRFKDSLDYEEAVNRRDEADQRVVEAHQRNIELQEKARDSNAKGIESNDRVVAANERLARSHQQVAAAEASAANVGGDTPGAKAADAMAKLAPNAREFVQTMISLKPAFTDLRNTDAQALFAGLGQSMRTLVASDLPGLKTGIGSIATAINGDLKQIFSSLGSDSTKGFLDRILGNTANADARIKASIDPLIHAFGTLAAIGSNSLPRLADAFDHVADRFDKFISAAAADGRLQKWIDSGLDAFRRLGDIALHIAETFHGVNTALDASGGKGLIALLDSATTKLAAFVNSGKGQQELTRFFQEGREEFHKWEPIIENIGHMLPEVFRAAKTTADEFRPIIQSVTDLLAKNPALLQNILDGYLAWTTVIEPIASVAGAVGGVIKVVKELKGFINDIGPAMKATTTIIEAESAKQVAAEERVAASAVEADAAAGGTGAAGRLARVGGLLGAAAGPVGIAAAGGLLLYDTLNGQDERETAFQKDMANAKTPQERDEVLKRYGRYIPPLAGTPGGPAAGAPALPGTPKQLLGPSGQPNVGTTGSMSDQAAWESLAAQGDPMAKWVIGGSDSADMAKRAQWALAHQDQDKPGWQPPASYNGGGPTPSGSGPGPTGGFPIEVHGDEFVISKYGRSKMPDSFWHAANQGKISPAANVGIGGDPSEADSQVVIDRYHTHANGPHLNLDPGGSVNLNDRAKQDLGGILGSGSPGNAGANFGTYISPGLRGFSGGGDVGDIHDNTTSVQAVDPRNAPVNPGSLAPQSVAPNPTGAGPGMLNSLISGIASGVQGPIGNAISLGSGLINQGANGSGGGGGGGGFNLSSAASIPGVWGLAAAGAMSDPQQQQAALTAWGSKTAQWLGNFAGKTFSSAAQIGTGAVLGGLGLNGLSAYGQAASQVGGFYLGDQSPFAALGGSGVAGAGDIGSQSIPLGDGNTVQIPTYGTAAGAPAQSGGTVPDWDTIASKESGGNWQTNTGNGYYGGLQFTQSSWEAAGGTQFAPRADMATPDQQKSAAANLFAMQGPGAWPNTFTSKPTAAPSGLMTLTPKQWGGVDALAASYGLTMTSGFRDPGGPTVAGVPASQSYHGSGRAHDYGGTPEQRLAFAQFMAANYGPQLKELIYDAPGFNSTIKDGRVVGPFGSFYTLAQAGDHSDHVHIAYDVGGDWPTGTVGLNTSGHTETVLAHDQAQSVHQALTATAQTINANPQPTPSLPQVPDAQHAQGPTRDLPPALQQPQATPAAAVPSPGSGTPEVPTSTPTGGGINPSLAPNAVAPAPSNLDHNLKAVDTGIDSAADAIGQAVSTAIGVAASAAGSSGFAPGAGAIGAIGPYAAGLIKEGGKVVKDVANVGSSFLVGDVTTGTQDLAYGSPLRPAQNNPNTGPLASVTNWNISGNYELKSAMQQAELKQAQDQQSAFASHPRTPGT